MSPTTLASHVANSKQLAQDVYQPVIKQRHVPKGHHFLGKNTY